MKTINQISDQIKKSFRDASDLYLLFETNSISTPDKYTQVKIPIFGGIIKRNDKQQKLSYEDLIKIFQNEDFYININNEKLNEKKGFNEKASYQYIHIIVGKKKVFENKENKEKILYNDFKFVAASNQESINKFIEAREKYFEKQNQFDEFIDL
jgi:hypothetical protein